MSEEAALAGIRVLDAAGSIATGYCGKLFADHGAVVVNAEPPEGFPTRREAPFLPDALPPENSALHAWLSTNKASAVVESADDIRDLARGAQVVLDDGRFDCDSFSARAPDVVVSTVTWFGRTGPYADYQGTDGVVQSLIGMVRGIGAEAGPPILPAGCQAQIVGGLAAYIGTLGQVIAREIGNAAGPVRLDTSIFEANLCFTEVGGVGGHRSGRRVRRMGVNRYPPTYPLGIYPCRDGWLGVTALTPSQWKSFCALLDMQEFADVPQYQSAVGRLQDADMLDPLIHERVRERSAVELFNRGQGARIPLALVPTMEQLFTVDQYVARRAFDEVRPPGQKGFTAPVTPFRLSRTPATRGGDVAALGSLEEAPAGAVGVGEGERPPLAQESSPERSCMSRPGLLEGVRVVDLSMGWAGPLAARHLADMGADVIKVEGCVRFDWWRGWEATQEWIDEGGAEMSPAFNMVNRNKRDLTLDLSTPEGADLLLRLVAISDVVVENYSAGVLPKLGLDYPVLAKANPEVVMISMPAFGSNGPWQGYRAYGSTVEQASGLPHQSGEESMPPTMIHVALGDSVGGLNGAAALLTALRVRRRTGKGQHLDLSQSECLFPLGIKGILTQSVTGSPPQRLGNRSLEHAPHGVYPCAGDDEWIVIQVRSEAEWKAFEAASGITGFGDVADRLARREELDEAVRAFTSTQVVELLMPELQDAGVAAARLAGGLELTTDPHLAARGFWKMMQREYVGELPHPAAPYRVGAAPFGIDRPAPTLGQHNFEVLTNVLGLAADEIAALAEQGVIGTKPRLP